jgi:adenylate kinase family enzyme
MERINVVGTSCSGKTRLARELARRLELPHVEMDALFWGPDWTPIPADRFRERVAAAAAADGWVMDGGYSSVRDLILSRADMIVWLDYPMATVLGRWARRTVSRIRSGVEFWPGTGNRESLRRAFQRDGLLAWILTTHRRRRMTMAAELAAHPELAHVRLRSPAATEEWLRSVRATPD